MPVEIDGTRYFSSSEVLKEIGVARQTLWRWRQDGKIPQGHRRRDRQVFFTAAEFNAIRDYANQIEPVEGAKGASVNQLKLFGGPGGQE